MATRKATAKKKTSAKGVAPATRVKPLPPTLDDLRRISRILVTATCMGELEQIFDLYSEGIESEEIGSGQIFRGIAAVEKKIAAWAKQHPEAAYNPVNMWCDGQTITIEWEITLKSKGRKGILRELAIYELREGKIIRERFYYDPAALA